MRENDNPNENTNPIDEKAIESVTAALAELSPKNQQAITEALHIIFETFPSSSKISKNDFAAGFANWLRAPITEEAARFFTIHAYDSKWSWSFQLDSAYANAINTVNCPTYREEKIRKALSAVGMTMGSLFEKAGLTLPEEDKLEELFSTSVDGARLSHSFPEDKLAQYYTGNDINQHLGDVYRHGPVGLAIAASYLQKNLVAEKQKTQELEQHIKKLEAQIASSVKGK